MTWPVRGVDDEAFHFPDFAVTRVHGLAASDAHLSGGEHVAGLDRTRQGEPRVGPSLQAEIGPVIRLVRRVRVVPTAAGEEVGLLGRGERFEFGQGGAEANLVRAGLHQVEGDEAAKSGPMHWLDHEMGELAAQRDQRPPGSPSRTARRCTRRRRRS